MLGRQSCKQGWEASDQQVAPNSLEPLAASKGLQKSLQVTARQHQWDEIEMAEGTDTRFLSKFLPCGHTDPSDTGWVGMCRVGQGISERGETAFGNAHASHRTC